jgi:ribA/ribD-fused uncharacterized protein
MKGFQEKDYLQIYDKFVFFYDGVLSNWADTPFVDLETHIPYNCSEQYMMHQKALMFCDFDAAQKIMKAKHPREQKGIGRTVKNFNMEIWKEKARQIIYTGCHYKFIQNTEAYEYLISTKGYYLVEASPFDTIWGVGLGCYDEKVKVPKNWLGTNWLGQVLTCLRDNLLEVQ